MCLAQNKGQLTRHRQLQGCLKPRLGEINICAAVALWVELQQPIGHGAKKNPLIFFRQDVIPAGEPFVRVAIESKVFLAYGAVVSL